MQKSKQVNRFCPVKKTIANKTKQKYHTLTQTQTHFHTLIYSAVLPARQSVTLIMKKEKQTNKQTKQK